MNIQDLPLFQGFTSSQIQQLQTDLRASTRNLVGQEILFPIGHRMDHMGIVLTGQLRIQHMNEDGEASMVSYIEEGNCFGESYALLHASLPVHIQATKESSVLLLQLSSLSALSAPSLALQRFTFQIAKMVAMKNQQMNQRMAYLTHKNMRSRLLAYFHDLKEQQHSSTITIPFQRQALADFLCIDRSAMSRELSNMKQSKLIALSKHQIQLL